MTAGAHVFLSTVRPALQAGDAAALAQTVRERWTCSELCALVRHPEVDVRRVAAVTLGLVGDRSAIPCLTEALRDGDEQVNEMAEHGLWSIWFRSCNSEATRPFKQGVAMMAVEAYEPAIDRFRQATRCDPGFAEGYNQCAIAHFFLGQWDQSLRDCCRAVHLMPNHFGAISGMGHSYAQQRNLPMALRCYRKALRINPRMATIAKAIARIQTRIKDSNDASGEFLLGALPS